MNTQFYESLKNNILFKNTDIASLNLDEVKGRLIRVGEGEIIYREGAPSDFIFLVVSGQVNIIKKKVLGKAKSYVYNENEFFGNDEYFEETTRTSTAIALLDTYLIILSRAEIENLILQDNEIFLALRESLSGLFDNSTEINVEDAGIPENIPSNEIDKVITGEEIQSGIEYREAPENDSTVEPGENITRPEMEISEEKQENPTVDISGDAIAEDIKEAEIKDFTLTEKDIIDIENSAADNSAAEAPQEKISGPAISAEEAFTAALGGIDQIELEQKATGEEIRNDNLFIKAEDGEIIMQVVENSAASLEDNDFVLYTERETSSPDAEKENEFLPAEISASAGQEENNIRPAENGLTDEGQEKIITPVLFEDETGGEMNKQEVNKIIKAMELVNSTVKIDDLLTSIVNVATDLTNADRGTLYLVDKEKGELWSKIALGTEPKEIRLKIGEGIAGNVAKTKTIENIKDVSQHPLFKKDVDKASGYVTKNMLCFPLKNKEDEVIGVLQLLNNKNGEFTENDEEVLSMISINTAIALQNAELVEKLLTAERVSSLGKMTNFLIQDIKKPVLVSKRYTEHLKSKNLAPEVTQLVDMILNELTQVSDLVQTTSSYAEGKSILRTSITGINSVLQDFVNRTEQFILSRHCKVNFEPDKEINVKIDTKEFYQCFLHLVKNACDAMPDGGILKIRTRLADKSVKIIFEDQGLGIPESFIDKIFEPFMTHGKKEGAGLGLSITKKIVEAHQGTIDVKSSLGAGAEFTITLPAGSSL